jgi:RimK-like ATP-grasp domain
MTSRAAAILCDFAARHSAELILSSNEDYGGGLLVFPDGRRQFFLLNQLGIVNPLGAFASLRARSCGEALLGHFGFRAAQGRLFARNGVSVHANTAVHSEAEVLALALDHAETLGWPVVVKANLNLNRNQGLTKCVADAPAFAAASAAVYAAKRDLLVQPFYSGAAHVCLVFDGEVRFVLRRSAMGKAGFTTVTDMHPSHRETCVSICRSFGLTLACIEIITVDIAREDDAHLVLQVDAAPDIAAFAGLDAAQRGLFEAIYADVFDFQRRTGGGPAA